MSFRHARPSVLPLILAGAPNVADPDAPQLQAYADCNISTGQPRITLLPQHGDIGPLALWIPASIAPFNDARDPKAPRLYGNKANAPTAITGITSGGGGLCRIAYNAQTPRPLKYQDWVDIKLSGSPLAHEASGLHQITGIVDSTHFQIDVPFVHAYTPGSSDYVTFVSAPNDDAGLSWFPSRLYIVTQGINPNPVGGIVSSITLPQYQVVAYQCPSLASGSGLPDSASTTPPTALSIPYTDAHAADGSDWNVARMTQIDLSSHGQNLAGDGTWGTDGIYAAPLALALTMTFPYDITTNGSKGFRILGLGAANMVPWGVSDAEAAWFLSQDAIKGTRG